MAVNQFRVGLRRLTSHWKPLLLFELLWKVLTVLVIAPACAGLIQLAIRGAKLNYLTTSNLVKFLRSPWTILLIAVILLLAALSVPVSASPGSKVFGSRWGIWCAPDCIPWCIFFGAADRFWCCTCWC